MTTITPSNYYNPLSKPFLNSAFPSKNSLSIPHYHHITHPTHTIFSVHNNFYSQLIPTNVSSPTGQTIPITNFPHPLPSHIAPSGPHKAADVLVEALEREGVTHVFAYPGGASMEIHQALTRSKSIRTILPRHEQGGILAAEGYARASGMPGVVVATSGPGATNLVTGLADAMADSIPVVAITGQVPQQMIGTDAFQEVPIVDITRSITKHNFLILDPNDIPRVVKEALFIAQTGRPGPVLIDIPKDVQREVIIPNWADPIQLSSYISRLPSPPEQKILDKTVDMLLEAKRPLLYVGGGCLDASEELRRFVELTGVPVASTLMGLGVFSSNDHDDEYCLGMLGMHGTICANYAVNHSDLLLAFGVRFDDRVTGKIEAFGSRAKIVHIDIDPSELGKNKKPHVSMHCDIKLALQSINDILLKSRWVRKTGDFSKWRNELKEQKSKRPLLHYKKDEDNHNGEELIQPEDAILVLNELTKGNAIITTGGGQHQMFTAQYYKFKSPRQWITSGGMGTMGGLPAAIGAATAKPGSLVIDIDGDGSFIMNIQELATVRAENLPVKIIVLNNQHLGMVVQLEDIFYKANRAHTYLGNIDMVKIAKACDIPGERVRKKSELREAMKRMLETPGPYLLDIMVPHQVHVLPMIPTYGTFQDVIITK